MWGVFILSTTGWAQSSQDSDRWRTDPRLSQGQIAPLLNGMGEHTHPVTAASSRAQRFFDQGLNLTFGFTHAEAIRAFQEAARLDPNCAMAYWQERSRAACAGAGDEPRNPIPPDAEGFGRC